MAGIDAEVKRGILDHKQQNRRPTAVSRLGVLFIKRSMIVGLSRGFPAESSY